MKRNKFYVSVPMSSMADVAFLLIIFFMATSVLKMDADLPIDLPEAKGGELKDVDINISIDKNQNYYYDNIPVTKSELIAKIQVKKLTVANPKIIVNAHSDLPYEVLEDLIESLRDLNISNLGIVTKQSERKL
ncbi:MAG: ExbD/TolR family protein [Leptonema sp. (in: bacteria)]